MIWVNFSRRDFIKTACISVGALVASSSGVYALDDSSKMDKDANYLLAMFW